MGKVIKFNQDEDFNEEHEEKDLIEKETSDNLQDFPPFLKDLREYILGYYPNTISDILGFSGFIKNDSPYVFVGYVIWQDKKGNYSTTPLIAMFRNQDKRFSFLNAKNHYFDPTVLKTDIENIGIDIEEIYKHLDEELKKLT
ncbi:MAG: hypothetical protein C0170_06895 [Hydrogenobaculum sp.]|nr:MAG: hypothetical protein C0170_06895 [Hydrogenobaculum sp.]HEK25771.1 hypothetical protein [Hydrogenobaculum sp.]